MKLQKKAMIARHVARNYFVGEKGNKYKMYYL